MDEKLLELVAKLESLAPHIWATAMRQVYRDAIYDCIIGVGVLLFMAAIVIFGVREARAEHNGDEAIWYIVGVGIGLVAILLLVSAIQKFINPQWYAIKLLEGLIPK